MPLRDARAGADGLIDGWALLQRAGLQMAMSKRSQTKYEEILTLAGGTPFVNVWANPETQGAMGWAVATHGRDLVVTIRGTSNSVQWAGHVAGSWGREYPDGDRGQYVHILHYNVMDLSVYPSVQVVLAQPPPGGWDRVIISGHSYGASVATLLGIRLARTGWADQVQVTTFGTPRSLAGDFGGPPAYPQLNVMGPHDAITRMPPTWASLRMAISSAAGGVLGSLGIGFIGKLVGGSIVKAPFNLPAWTHYGQNVALAENGNLRLIVPPTDPNLPHGESAFLQPVSGHLMQTYYWPALRRGLEFNQKVPPALAQLFDIGDYILDLPTIEDGDPYLGSGRVPEAPFLADVYFPGVPGTTGPSLIAAEGVTVELSPTRATATIGDSLRAQGGGGMATWKFTMFIKWSPYGRSLSIHRTGPEGFKSAAEAALQWVQEYSKMLGSAGEPPLAGQFYVGAPGSPVIEWVRISDAFNPRISRRIRVPGDMGAGFWTTPTNATASDAPWVAFSLGLLCTAAGRTFSDTTTFLGLPDGAYQRGGYFPAAVNANGTTVQASISSYLNHILNANLGYGSVGRNPVVVDRNITTIAPDGDGAVALTITAGEYVSGDWIRVKSTRDRYLDRTWIVKLNVNGTFTLQGSSFAKIGNPVAGKTYRVRTALGVPDTLFYPYSELFDDVSIPDRLQATKRDPARGYTPLASRRRRRTPAK